MAWLTREEPAKKLPLLLADRAVSIDVQSRGLRRRPRRVDRKHDVVASICAHQSQRAPLDEREPIGISDHGVRPGR